MAKSKPAKPHNNGTWTDARKKSFIISALRGCFNRWGPKQLCIKNARTRRGFYKCECCKEEVPATLPPKPGNKKRIKNIVADHIEPIVSPEFGFQGYDEWIRRGFVELDGFQALCHSCHQIKCEEERALAKKPVLVAHEIDISLAVFSFPRRELKSDTRSPTVAAEESA